MKISATIIAFNEESNIRAACESVRWADEILVVDSKSTDRTREIAESCGARVIVRAWSGFAAQKQFAATEASHDWILSLDADERVSDELRDSVITLEGSDEDSLADGYLISRRSFYMGRWIKGGGWYPDYQLRFYNRSRGSWHGAYVHESVKMADGSRIDKLRGTLYHYSTRSAIEHHRMIGERYAPLAAKQMFEAGHHTNQWQVISAGPLAFLRCFILKGGFRDGFPGYCIARFAAHHAYLKYLLLWEMQRLC